MLKSLFLTSLTLLIAVGGGVWSVWWAIDSEIGFGTIEIGNWTASPTLGTPAADPYSKARFARDADLVLGGAEGLVFTATSDSDGRRLRPSCDYVVEGAFPAARFWTLHARNAAGEVLTPPGERAPALHSYALLRQPDGSSTIAVASHPSPGNWLAVDGSGFFTLVLTLYDTAIASTARIAEVELPQIIRTACDD